MILILLLLLSGNVWAATSSGNTHHMDTKDYCLMAKDVTIGLTEIQGSETSEEIHAHILEAANIMIRIWDPETNELHDPLGPEAYTVDFSGFILEASQTGYPVTITAEPITEELESAVTFLVTVVDDLPKQRNVRVRFSGTKIPNLVLDITTGDYNLHMNELAIPEKEDYTFLGWYLDEAGTQPYLLADSEEYASQKVGADIILYPAWKKTETSVIPPPIVTEPITPTPTEPTPTEPTPAEPTLTEPTPTNPTITEPTKAETEPQTTTPETTILERPKQDSKGTGAVAAVPPGTETPTPTPSPEVTEPETTEAPEPDTDTVKTVPQQESGMTGIAYGAAGTCIAALLVLGAGILSDLRVLKWYASKGLGG
ncbi:MAG: InlB B-repeat-containing protein [Lachnospiraceae bacterium]|nr:InlB B-repeat-containing protein [Lachnospiraceae bacterium]